ncbi:hypothetical protein GALMADRAFT_147214 [Galerina marginata CBS 339.88]|uniref:DUF6533 domain-containing protein n=1 Tax=Galerina marginata (strain CBS 339.88) TaxID=685588 RepID=A0A067SL36_GALM3|nr:hypothetical protein GALMADRAFT_147214 [Galerina marginata CBS 339.88]
MSYSPYDPQYSTVIYNSLYLLGWTIQYWDYLLTFDDEIRYIWQPTKSKGQYWFYLNRYIPFFGNLAVIVCNFSPLSPKVEVRKRSHDIKRCSRMIPSSFTGFTLFHQVLIIAIQIIVAVILGLRTYALYNCSKILLTAIIVLWAGCLATVAWSVSPHEGGAVSRQTGFRLAAAWESLLVYDLFIFVLTLFKSRKRLGGNNLVSLMLRDGAIYSGVILAANTSNVITYYVGSPYLKGCLATFSSSVSLTMMNRLILNLRKNTDDVQISILSGSLQFEHEHDNNHSLDSGEGDWRVGSTVEDE